MRRGCHGNPHQVTPSYVGPMTTVITLLMLTK